MNTSDPEYARIFKEKLLNTFKYTVSFLEKNNLKYWACGGTCIGAIRHKGFIPWDDDIDIMMPRDDYYKLLSLVGNMKGSGYKMVSIFDKGYYYDFGKIMDENTTIWEYKKYPFLLGVYVDVYPFYQTDLSIAEINRLIDIYDDYRWDCVKPANKISLKDLFFDNKNFDFRLYLSRIKYNFSGISFEKIIENYKKFESQLDRGCGDHIVSYIQGYPGKKIYDKYWFDELLDWPFEDTTIKVPKEYDLYLKHVFGDYMTLPPEDKRISLHDKYYANLREGLDLSEVKKRITNNEFCVY